MRKKEVGKVFPNINATIAYYDPIAFNITLNEISEREFGLFSNKLNDKNQFEKFSVFVHELRHYYDHISTLWGQKNIYKLFAAANARVKQNEFEFHNILPLKIEEQQFHYDTYYSVQGVQSIWNGPGDNWGWRLSAGLKFDINGKPDDNRPILFINFATQAGDLIVRVPLSIAALLETNAIHDELQVKYKYIKSLKRDEALIESRLLQREIFKTIIYEQQMAVYNSVVHLTANILELKDIKEAFSISSAISTFCLNIPNELVGRIPIPKIAEETWKNRCIKMLGNHDYAFIFYCILMNYGPSYKQDRDFNLERLLSANQLPKSDKIINLIDEEFNVIVQTIQKEQNFKNIFLKILEEGRQLFQKRGLYGTNSDSIALAQEPKFKPLIVCNDTDFPLENYEINNTLHLPMDNLSSEQWYSFAMTINEKFDEFFDVRGL